MVKNAKNAVNNDGLTEQLVERDYKILVELVRKADSSSYSISVASSDIASLCLGSDCCGIKGYLDKRIKSNSDLKSIMEYKIEAISPALYVQLQHCPATSAAIERSFSMLNKFLAKDRPFLDENIADYFMLHYNSIISNKS